MIKDEKQPIIDKWILLGYLFLNIVGMAMLYSVTQANSDNFYLKQLIWFLLSMFVGGTIYVLPIRLWEELAYPIYLLSIGLLVAVLFAGLSQGTHRWFSIGAIKFQPSEFAKIAFIFGISKFLYMNRERDINHRYNISSEKNFFKSLFYILKIAILIGVPMLLTIKEPDLGTALVFIPVFIGMFFVGTDEILLIAFIILPGLSILLSFSTLWWSIFFVSLIFISIFFKYFYNVNTILVILLLVISIGAGFVSPIVWNKLKPYQRERILTFLNPERDPVGSGYQVIQGKIAIGSGGIYGKGYKHSTQRKSQFLPEAQNDFIFSIIGEEFGLIGSVILITVILLLTFRIFYISLEIRNNFARMVVIGIGILFGTQSFINIAINLGLLPVTGLPLPFISYGGSSLLIFTIMFSFILSFYRQRDEL